MEYSFERISEENIVDLISIAESAFGVRISLDVFMKEYETSYTGVNYLGYLAYSSEKIPAAFYGVFPLFGVVDTTKILLAQSGNTMTHKDHQGKGLFVKLAKLTYELCEKENVKAVFGFPNENSFPGFQRKLNWHFNGHLLKYSKRVNSFPVAFLAFKYNWFNNLYLKFYQKYFTKREWFQSSIIDHQLDGLERSLAYWNYKSYHPNFTFQVMGVKVWAKINSTLYIGDVEFKEGVDYELVFQKINKYARKFGCPKIVLQISEGHWLNNYLSLNFVQEKSLPFGYIKTSKDCPDLNEMQFTLADFDTF